MRIALSVAFGAGLGGLFRVAVAACTLRLFNSDFPFGILLVNVVGSFLIGFLATITAPDSRFCLSPASRQFALAGFCGGFTTFSFFSLQTMLLLEDGKIGAAVLYSVLTLMLGMIAVWLGHGLGVWMNRS